MNYFYTNNPVRDSADTIASTIKQHLDTGEKVLWLLSGGSSSEIATIAGQQLAGYDLSRLSVSLTDERFGNIGHENENWQHLLELGLLLPGASIYRPLINKDINTTTFKFNEWIKTQLEQTDYSLGIFGIGLDGHTAGIKPFSTTKEFNDFTYSYRGDDFERITIGFRPIALLDEAIIQISGKEKKPILRQFMYDTVSLEEQPAQALKTIHKITIYSDIKKEDI